MSANRPPSSTDGWPAAERGLERSVVLLLALGVALAAIALLLLTDDPSTVMRVSSAMIGALAGGIVGASLSAVVNRSLDYAPLAQMRSILERTTTSRLSAPEHEVRDLRRVWHHYHQTLIAGRVTWRYGVLRFDNHAAIGTLTADLAHADVEHGGTTHVYRVDAATRGPRMILVQSPLQGTEAPALEVFPHLLYEFRRVHAGIGVMQTWDGQEVLSATLLSPRPLTAARRAGSIPAAEAERLDHIWHAAFASIRSLVPPQALTGERPETEPQPPATGSPGTR
jgi:hypothetical protein